MLQRAAERVMRLQMNLFGLESRYFASSVGAIHYYAAAPSPRAPAARPPLVLLHGLGAGATHYRALIAHLRPHFGPILAPDAPGHGFSAAPNGLGLTADICFRGLRELLDAAPAAPFVLFGNSLGGAAALRYAAERPDRVRALIVVSPAGAPMAPDALAAWLREFDLRTHQDARAFLDRVYHKPPWYLPLMAAELRRLFAGPTVRQLLGSVREDDHLTPERAAAVTAPTLLVWGKRDRIAPREQLAWLVRHLPGHTVVREPDTWGHSPYLEAPRAVADDVIAFVRQALAS